MEEGFLGGEEDGVRARLKVGVGWVAVVWTGWMSGLRARCLVAWSLHLGLVVQGRMLIIQGR